MRRLRLIARLVAFVTAGIAFVFRALAWSRRHGAAPSQGQVLEFAGRPSSSRPTTETEEEPAPRRQTEHAPPRIHLPAPTIWPLTIAGGVALVAFGIVTAYAFSALGIFLILWGILGWIQDMIHG